MNLWSLRGRIRGRGGEGIDMEFGIDMCTLLFLKWITNKELLSSMWNSAWCYVAASKEVWGRMDKYVYCWLPSLFIWNYRNIVNRHTPIQNKKLFLLKKKKTSWCMAAVLCIGTQSCLTLCDPMDCSPPDSTVHGDSPGQNTGVGWHASSRGSSHPRDQAQVSYIAGRFFTSWATREAWCMAETNNIVKQLYPN